MEQSVSVAGAPAASVLRTSSPLQTKLDAGQFWAGRPGLPILSNCFLLALVVCRFGWEVPGIFSLSITSMFSVLPRQRSVVGSAALFFPSPLQIVKSLCV